MKRSAFDPPEWNCLDDEQRSIIQKWYGKICEQHQKKLTQSARNKEAAAYFGIIPFAVVMAYMGFAHEGVLSFLIALPVCYLCSGMIYAIFSFFYYRFNHETKEDGHSPHWISVAIQSICAILVSIAGIIMLKGLQ